MARPTVIAHADREYTDEEVARVLEPEVRRWFFGKYDGLTPPQRFAVKEIHDGKSALISSPTGSGKTLSAFLAAINELTALSKRGELEDQVYALYVSPLKALNNDIERNLQGPLQGIREAFEARGEAPPDIRVGVRTGDTPQSERQAQTRKPPHIFITTPESLAIALCSPKLREHLQRVRWIIVDEVHALAENKRGAHLSLSLERLSHWCPTDPVRVGLSATIAPLDEIGRFLVGARRPCLLVDVQYAKETELSVVSPVDDLVHTPTGEATARLYTLLDGLIEDHRTTLVFTNTRSGTERVVHHLKERFGDKYATVTDDDADGDDEEDEDDEGEDDGRELVAAHHGSMSRDTRLEVEEALKRGELKSVVCSTSLELGIDIGYVDLVTLLGSPKGIARALQRVGRSGHRLHETSRGRIVVMDRDDLVECLVLARKARERRLDRVHIVEGALDVLCQHIVGMAINSKWQVDDAYDLVTGAHPYRDLSREDFHACLAYLAGHHEELKERRVYGKIWWDEEEGVFGRRGKMVRPIYYLNVGTIPDSTQAKVFCGDRFVGTVEEDFLERLDQGDVFVLGGKTYRFRHARGMKVRVSEAPGKDPTVPSWYSEQLPLSLDLAREVQAFRAEVADRLAHEPEEETLAWLQAAYEVDETTGRAVLGYFREQARFAAVPTSEELLVEDYVDDGGRRNVVFHTVLGRRANEALARAFARHVGWLKGCNVGVIVSDNGFVLQTPRWKILTANDVRGLFHLDVREELRKALDNTEILKRRFRHVAARSFLILRNYPGRSKSVGRQQVDAFVLYHVLKKLDPDFPVLKETYREVFEDAFDVKAAEEYAYKVLSRQVRVTYLQSRRVPSPFAFNLVVMGSQDTVVMEDRRRLVQELHQRVLDAIDAQEAREAERASRRWPTSPRR